MLGRSGTYERVATQRGSTFFHTSEARWSEVEQMWRINQAFLDQQIAAGKSFVLANNPITDGGYYFAKEVAYLAMKGVSYAVLK